MTAIRSIAAPLGFPEEAIAHLEDCHARLMATSGVPDLMAEAEEADESDNT